MFSKYFSLKVILIKARKKVSEPLLILQFMKIFSLYGTWLSHSILILSAVVCGLLTSPLNIV